MKIPRNLSGHQLVQILCSDWGYRKLHQTGSHVVLQTQEPKQHRIAVPDHKALRIGTLLAILRSVSTHKGVSRDEILKNL